MSYIQNSQNTDLIVTGTIAQSVLNNNVLNVIAGAPAIDVSALTSGVAYASFSTQIIGSAGISAGAIFFEGSNNGIDFLPVPVWEDSNSLVTVITAITVSPVSSKIYNGNINTKFLRCRISTAFVGGTIQSFNKYSVTRLANNARPILPPYSVTDVASSALTTTTTSSTIIPISGTSYVVTVPVTATSGTGETLQVVVQETFNNIAWQTVYSFPSMSSGATTKSSPPLLLSGIGIRYLFIIAGTAPSFTCSVLRAQANSTPLVATYYPSTATPSLSAGQSSVLQATSAGNLKVDLSSTSFTLSTINSSAIQLAANGVFTGSVEAVSRTKSALVLITCDQNYTAQINQYMDSAGTKLISTETFTRLAGEPVNEVIQTPGNYAQLVVTNTTAIATTAFEAQTLFGTLAASPRALTNKGNSKVSIEEGGVFNTTLPTVLTTKTEKFQLDSNARLITSSSTRIPYIVTDITSAAITGTITTASFTPVVGSGYIVSIPVTVVTGTLPTLIFSVEESIDNVSWKTVYTFPVISVAGTYNSPKLSFTGARIRYVETITGTLPSFTHSVVRSQINGSLVTGEYNLVSPTLTNGANASLQMDVNGKLKVAAGVPADTSQVTGAISSLDTISTLSVGMNNQTFIVGIPTGSSFLTFALSTSNSLRFQVMGTWVGTIQAEASLDAGLTYTPIMVNQVGMHTFVTSFTSNINGTVNAASFTHFRLRAIAWTSGTANVLVVNSANLGSVQLANSLNGGTIAYPVDKSGSITAGGTAQVLMPINSSRGGWWIMNTSGAALYVNELGTATAASIPVLPNQEYTPPTITAGAISIIGATTAQTFIAREWNGIPATSSVLNGGLVAVGPLPASGSLSVVSAITKSTATSVNASVTVGGVFQVLLALNLNRIGFEFFNNSSGDLWLAFGVAPTIGTGIRISAGTGYVTPVNISYTNAINVIGAVTAQAFTVIEY